VHKSRWPFLSLVVSLFALSTQAIVYIVPSDRDLVNNAQAIVIGTAMASHPEMTATGGIVTVADLRIESVLKGAVSEDSIRIVEPGGFMSDHAVMIPGSPRFEQGTRYLLFLERSPDGEWRTSGFQLGQFEFIRDLRGMQYLSRGGEEWIFGLDARDGSEYVDRFRTAGSFENFVRTLAVNPNGPARDDYFVDRGQVLLASALTLQPQRKLVPMPNFTRPDYLLSGNFRWSNGGVATWHYCCAGQYPTVGGVNAPGAAASGAQGWNGLGSINYTMGAENTKTGGLSTADGSNTILFNDPNNELGCCPGAVAIGGIRNTSGTYTLDGITYNNSIEGDVVVNKNANLPGFLSQSLLVALLKHEIGHTLGFRHSDGTASPTSPPPACAAPSPCAAVGSAVMAHSIQSPGLGLQQWDRDAALTVYGSGPVCTPPSISSGPTASPATINSGQSSTLSVTAGGSGPLSYQWYQGSPPSTATPLGTSSSISVSPTSTSTYWVRVTGQCSPTADSGGVTVTVSCTPVITAQPLDQQVTSGGTATLSVAFTSASAVTVDWFRGVAGDTTTPVGTGTSFTTPAIAAPTNFWARLTNACGTKDTRTVTISIAPGCTAPSNVVASVSATSINAGDSVSLQTSANGTSPLAFQWFRGTAPDESNPISGATTFAITATPTATTSYWVKVNNACGFARSNTVTVTVTGPACVPASITTHPQSVTISFAASTTLSVAAAGTNLHFAWFQGTTGQMGTPVGTDSANFTTPPLTSATQYWVHVTNDCGDASSFTATVTVKPGRRRSVRH
jgi:hypothetical protein